jgi:hypothetical protein
MYLRADRRKHHCVCPSFESPEPSAQERPLEIHGKQEECNREDMGCGVDECFPTVGVQSVGISAKCASSAIKASNWPLQCLGLRNRYI